MPNGDQGQGEWEDKNEMVDVESRSIMIVEINSLYRIKGLSKKLVLNLLQGAHLTKKEEADMSRSLQKLMELLSIEVENQNSGIILPGRGN